MDLIDEFMERYIKEYDYYNENARICAEKCELELERNGIRAIVTYRAKRPDRLRLKLEKRIIEKKYKSIKDIYEDIIDFAGVRIALYFPSDRDEITKLIESNFRISKVKKFPVDDIKSTYPKRFSGYWATHYRCTLREDKVSGKNLRYTNCMVEIQVASVLMHAWSEVQHDLVYKPLSGELSEDEYALLDQLNGLVMSGEIALERLQNAVKARVAEVDKQFNNHYEFSAYMYDAIRKHNSSLMNDELVIIGRVDILFKFLQLAGLDRPDKINKYLANVSIETEKKSVVEQIVDEILSEQPTLFEEYFEAKHAVGFRNPYSDSEEIETKPEESVLGSFITRWIRFESIITKIYLKMNPGSSQNHFISIKLLENMNLLDDNIKYQYIYLNQIRNELVHGKSFYSNAELTSAGENIMRLIKDIRSKVSNDLKKLIDEEIKTIDGN